MDDVSIEEVLAGCEFFKEFEEEEIESISAICRMESFEAGDSLFRQGDFGKDLYVIAEGQVFLERATDLGGRKGSVVISMLGKGRVCGCWSSLLNDAHHLMSSAVCQKVTRVVVVEGDKLRRMMQRDNAFGFGVLEKLCFLLRDRIQGAYGALEKI
jgi:CRP-like cAMP-binding protein